MNSGKWIANIESWRPDIEEPEPGSRPSPAGPEGPDGPRAFHWRSLCTPVVQMMSQPGHANETGPPSRGMARSIAPHF